MKIVLADDNREILETTEMALQIDGHEVIPAPQASGILAAAAGADLILQDINMPGLVLDELLDALQAGPGTPVVIFSAQQPEEAILEHPLVHGFLPKPFDLAEIRDVLARIEAGA